jgi:hypothetical protein
MTARHSLHLSHDGSTTAKDLADGAPSTLDLSAVEPDLAASAAVGKAGAALIIARSAAQTQALYLKEPGDTAAISVNDINQGQMGDCFLLSAIGELALWHPDAITNMIHVNRNGSETVTLYMASNGQRPYFNTSAYKPSYVTVTNDFPSNSVNSWEGQDVVGNQKEIWPQVIEKAFATENGGYAGIAYGGFPVVAMEELTGHMATAMRSSSFTVAALQADIAAGDLIVMNTAYSANLPYNLVPGHAYMFEKLVASSGGPMVQLGNPWGFNQPALIPFAQLSNGISEVDVGRVH